jgi:abequosyltransferase
VGAPLASAPFKANERQHRIMRRPPDFVAEGATVTLRLSICIATYNRSAFLAQTLLSVLPQLTPDCEIVICDNASSDDTARVVAQFAGRTDRIRYHRQDTNVGLDRNFDTAVALASGEFCWLFGDDDVFHPDAIATVLRALNAHAQVSLALVNYGVASVDLRDTLVTRALPVDADRCYGPDRLDDLFSTFLMNILFIGCVVIRRSVWMRRQRANYYGSLLIHVGVIFEAPLPAGALVISTACVTYRDGNTRSFNREALEIIVKKLPALISGTAISAPVKSTFCAKLLSPGSLIFYRAIGSYSLAQYRHSIRPQIDNVLQRAASALIALLPAQALNSALILYYKTVSRHGSRHDRITWLRQGRQQMSQAQAT